MVSNVDHIQGVKGFLQGATEIMVNLDGIDTRLSTFGFSETT